MEKVPTKPFESKPWPDLTDSDDSDIENEIDVDKLPPLEVGPNENRLQHTYCLWFSRKGTHRATDYSKSLHVVGRCASVQQWWSLYTHLIRPTALKPFRELSLFKQGIKPMWEDPANTKGGQWVIRLRKHKIDRAWENVCMAMLGEQFLVGDEICGVVLTTKYPIVLHLVKQQLNESRTKQSPNSVSSAASAKGHCQQQQDSPRQTEAITAKSSRNAETTGRIKCAKLTAKDIDANSSSAYAPATAAELNYE